MTSATVIAEEQARRSAQHQLVGNRIVEHTDPRRASADCTCGWTSGKCFSSLTAAALFRDHQEEQSRG